MKFIFVAGLDTRPGLDISAEAQSKLFKDGFGNEADIIVFRFIDTTKNNSDIKLAIRNNPTAPVILFSSGCSKSVSLTAYLKSLGRKTTDLYANEPYTVGYANESLIKSAIADGLPASQVFSGPSDDVGNNITGSTKLPNRGDHWKSLIALGKFVRNKLGIPPAETQQNTSGQDVTQATQTGTASTQQTGTQDGQNKSRGEIKGQESSSTEKNGQPVKFITQLVEPKIKAKVIKVLIPTDERAKQEILEGQGFFPVVFYGTYQIRYNDIQFFQLYTAGNLPTVKVTFDDSYNLMKDKGFPLDDSLLSVFIHPRTDQLKPIHMDFKIVKFSVEGRTYTMTGVVDVNLLYIKKFKSYSSKTSFQTLKSIAEEAGLGFASNIDDTDDSMIWINPGKKIIDFMADIANNSYKSDEAYLISYIDFYYNLTYVEVEKELRRNIEQDLGIANTGAETFSKMDKELTSKIFLTNSRTFSNSNSYFSEHRIINNSSSISLSEGYSTKVKYYDSVKKSFLIFDVESITTDAENSIVLKGAPQDEEFYKENTELSYMGKIDEDNMYKNYHYANIQNHRNLVELEKIGIEVTMKTPNFNLYRFQKVIVNVASGIPTPSQTPSNNRLTGQWLIVDIMYRFDGKLIQQIIKLVRKELSLSAEEAEKESFSKATKKDDGRGTSTNPDPGTEPAKSTQSSTGGTQSGETVSGNLPDVTNESSQMAASVPSPPQTTGKTSPSGYKLAPGSYLARERKPTQIMLHYSAGYQITDKCHSTTTFVSETRGLTYHYIISVDGHIENLVDAKFIAYHGKDANGRSIGISMECLGTTYYNYTIENANKAVDGWRLNKYQPLYKFNEDIVYFVDINGNRKKYRNLPHGQEVSIKQLNSLRALLISLKKRFPDIPSFNGLTAENFDQIFSEKANYSSAPGLLIHGNQHAQKSDIAPTPRIVSFLKSLRY